MFLEQAIRLVSQSPDNLAYHILTLLAVQAALSIALWQWRQNRQDLFAGRLAGAAAIVFLLRIILAAVLATTNQSDLRLLLPPLERAMDMTTTAVIVWALVPSLPSSPRLNEVALFLGLIAIIITYLLAAQEWPQLVALDISYAQTNQAAAWAIAQLATIGVALALLLISRPRDWGIRFFTLLPLGIAHLAHLLGITPSGEFVIDSALPYWVRLAYLISLPLLAVLAYRHNLAQLLSEQLGTRPIVDQFSDLLSWSSGVIFTPKLEDTLRGSVQFAANLMGATFVAVGVMGEGDHLNVMSLRPNETGGNPNIYCWILKISDWPGMQLSLRQRAAVELLPNGIGARQLFGLYQELGIPAAGAMLIEPVFGSRGQQVGLLLLGGAPHLDRWSEDDKALTPHVASFVGQAVENAQIYEAIAGVSAAELSTIEQTLNRRIRELEAELAAADARIEGEAARLEQSLREQQVLRQQLETQTESLKATSTELNTLRDQPAVERIYALEEEIETLREALQQAEEAMAMASAGEAGLSTDWVVMAITRYSAELEEAQRRIALLEAQLDGSDEVEMSDMVSNLSEELRRPMTAIAGYTDILLSESMGILTNNQRALLEKVQSGTARMEQLLNSSITQSQQIVQIRPSGVVQPINVTETLETAVNELLALVREKQLTLDLDIEPTLPPLPVQRDVLYRITLDLLRNAVNVSAQNGRVQLIATAGELANLEKERESEFGFLQLIISDSGAGIPAEMRPYIFNTPPSTNGKGHAAIQGVDDPSRISRAYSLARLNGGRIWVESEEGHGSQFYVLLPVLA